MINLCIAAIFAVAAPQDSTMVRLVGQQSTIAISSSANGPRYSATDALGRPLCTDLSLNELRAHHPQLSRQVDGAVCADSSAFAGLE